MDSGRIQKLLMTDEYADFEDAITVESVFLELDKSGEPLRQVFLGLTRDSLLLASEEILNYKKCPWVIYDADVDVNTEWMELEWIVPICFLNITQIQHEHILKVEFANKKHRYYMLTNIGGKENQKWKKWTQQLKDIKDDPYGHIKELQNRFTVPLELYDTGIQNVTNRKQRQSKAFDALKQGGIGVSGLQSESSLHDSRSSFENLRPTGIDRGRRRNAFVVVTDADDETTRSDMSLSNTRALLDIPKLQTAFSNLQTAISTTLFKPETQEQGSQTKLKCKENVDNGFKSLSRPKKKRKFGFLKKIIRKKKRRDQ